LDVLDLKLKPYCLRGDLDLLHLDSVSWDISIGEHSQARKLGKYLFEQLHPFTT